MYSTEKPATEPSFFEAELDAPPAYTPQPQTSTPEKTRRGTTTSDARTSTSTSAKARRTTIDDEHNLTAIPNIMVAATNDERNPSFIPSIMGEKKVHTTYHVYLEQNYMRKCKHASVKHLNSNEPTYFFEFPGEGGHAGQMLLHAGASSSSPLIGTASFAMDFGSSALNLSDGRLTKISVVKRANTNQKVRLFRVDTPDAELAQYPNTMFWEMGSHNHGSSRSVIGNLELIDEDRKVYAVLLTAFHKSLKKMGRLHFLVEPNEALVEMTVGSLMAIWKKAEKDVRSGHLGLTT